jgi:hypothetical protein
MSDIVKSPIHPVTIRRVLAGEEMGRTLSVSSFCRSVCPENGYVITPRIGQKLDGTPTYIRDSDLAKLIDMKHDEEVVVYPWENEYENQD